MQQRQKLKVKLLFGKYEEFPIDWQIKTFGELFKFLISGNNSRDDLQETGDVYYIHYGDIHAKWHSVLDCDLEEIPMIDKAKVQDLPFLKEGDLIIADASEDYEGSGASVLLRNVKDRKIVSGLHTIAIRNIDESISSDFKTYLNSIKFVKSQIIAYVTGISVYGLSKNNLKKIRIPLPPIKEQQKIASILSNVDELIQKTEQIIEQTQRLKKGLINKLVINGLDVRGLSSKKITKNYRYEQLNQVAIINPKYKLQNHNEYPFVEMAAINEKTKSIEYFSNRKQASGYSIFKNDDTIFARITPCTENGKTCLVSNLNNYGLGSTEFIVLSPIDKNELLPAFLCYYCQTDKVRNYAISQMRGATGRQRVPDKVFKNDLFIILPNIETQKKIVYTIKSVENFVNKVQNENKKTENLKKGLMQQVLTGKIRVKV